MATKSSIARRKEQEEKALEQRLGAMEKAIASLKKQVKTLTADSEKKGKK